MSNLIPFLQARIEETDERLRGGISLTESGRTDDESWVLLVQMWDHLACIRSVVEAAASADPEHPQHTVLRRVVLIHCQPFENHPDFDPAWLRELAGLVTSTEV